MSPFNVGWIGGPRTQIELSYNDAQLISVRYAPGHRSTVRIPVQPQAFDFAPIDALMKTIGAPGANRDGGGATVGVSREPDLQTIGSLLVSALPDYIVAALQRGAIDLELGIAENLLHYPWELMHDGEDYLCLRHNVARYINATAVDLSDTPTPTWWEQSLPEIRVLIISVPEPEPRGNQKYDKLVAVAEETRAIMKALAEIPNCKPNWLPSPSMIDVHREMLRTRYHIVHYCGHAEFGGIGARQGKLILHKDDMPAQVWKTLLQKTEAIVCLLNGCETARQDAVLGGGRYGLARAVLDTGAYLVGTAWKVNDDAARVFGEAFYTSFLRDHESIGVALRKGRAASRKDAERVAAWASYVLYGDPRLRLEYTP